jgi:sugar/nucleoside kinase (ribokinase family)
MDGILINMVSGVDITINTLQKIRKNFGGYMHLDIHNVVMQTDETGGRTQSSINNWEVWCKSSDTLQMNESELHVITPENLSEYEFAERVLTTGDENYGRALVVTRGKSGVSLFRKTKKKVMGEEYFEIDKSDLAAIESNHFVDSTGCGDVFSSSFFYRSISNGKHDYKTSLNFANRMASVKTKIKGVEELHKLKV